MFYFIILLPTCILGISIIRVTSHSKDYEEMSSQWRSKWQLINEIADGVHMGCTSSNKDVFKYRHKTVEKNSTLTLEHLIHQTGVYYILFVLIFLSKRYVIYYIYANISTICLNSKKINSSLLQLNIKYYV